jgi:hypothetical protein
VLGREPVEGQQIGLGVLQQPGDLGCVRAQLLGDLAESLTGFGGRGGGEDAADGADTSGCWARATWPSMSRRK